MFWYPKNEDYQVRDSDGVTLKDFLVRYDPGKYERPAVTVDNLILKLDDDGCSILLIRRGRHPAYGMLALPGGFVEMDETLEAAAARELFEETGLSGIPLIQLSAYGEPNRDPRMRIITVAYVAIISKDVNVKAGDDADDAGFYRVFVTQKRKELEKVYEICFKNEVSQASAIIVEAAGKRMIADSSIASDHSIMILDALERLGLVENK
jgi:8-oxo-dGTP diphosphatase